MSAARDGILARIRSALGDARRTAAAPVACDYRVSDGLPPAERLELFSTRVHEYKAVLRRVAPDALAATIAEACASRGVRRLALPADVPPEWVPSGVEALRDPGLTVAQLDECDGVLTGCALAIAQTGTVVLDAGPLQGRRALTLVPDYHLCVVRAEQVVGLVPEAVRRLGETSATRPITFISGPSATSDIELNRVEGVHGPRTLEVVLVDLESA
jgi:L-lactate dehydrogenase complex protein LldG